MVSFPNAKINIGLNITEKRKDGYHNLETVFYPVKIKDILEMVPSAKTSFVSVGTSIPGSADDNLCLKAYHLIAADYLVPPIDIGLYKNIPIGAGLGGGSADAAFLIRLLNEAFSLNLSVDRMKHYASKLGADCAFFIDNSPAFAFGIGDQLEKVNPDLSAYELVLVMPPVFVSTANAFRYVVPRASERSLKELIHLPVESWKNFISNDFEISVFKQHPEISALKNSLYERGALYASMSGSGAAVYGIFKTLPDLSDMEKSNQVFYRI